MVPSDSEIDKKWWKYVIGRRNNPVIHGILSRVKAPKSRFGVGGYYSNHVV